MDFAGSSGHEQGWIVDISRIIEQPLTTDQPCWYLNERSFYEKFKYGNIILASTGKVELSVDSITIYISVIAQCHPRPAPDHPSSTGL